MVVSAPTTVVVHPTVLLSVVDHYSREARDTSNRVVGILLGEVWKGRVDVTNSYAVPFEEDARDAKVWFLDHNYHEAMFTLFKKVNAREEVVGWYSTGPKIREADLAINDLVRSYIKRPVPPVFAIVDVSGSGEDDVGLPVKTYCGVEKADSDGQQVRMEFVNVPCEVGAVEAEEVGVEHLLRNAQDARMSSLGGQVRGLGNSLRGLEQHLDAIDDYLGAVTSGQLPVSQEVLAVVQDMFNLLPDVRASGVTRALTVANNDSMLGIFVANLVRAVIATHNLIDNRIDNKEREAAAAKEKEAKAKEARDAKAKAKADKEAAAAAAAAAAGTSGAAGSTTDKK